MAEPATPTTETGNRMLLAALDHARRGWRVFPLRPGDKRPAIKDWETRATTDRERITRAWRAGPFNIGIATGPSGLVVLDLDQPKPGVIPPAAWRHPGIRDGGDVLAVLADANDQPLPAETYTVRTCSDGTHLYFTAPPGVTLRNSAGRLGWLIDTRAHGGYVVAAGSRVAGHTYVALVDISPARLPGWLAERLTDPDPAPSNDAVTTVGNPTAYAAAALRGELDRVLAAQPGRRNHTLNTAAFALGQLLAGGLLTHQLAEDALSLAGQAIGLPAGECAATIRSGLNSGARTPRTAA